MNETFRISTPSEEGILNVSRWNRIQVFLDQEEVQSLFQHLQDFYLVVTSEPIPLKDSLVSKEEFLEAYALYLEDLLKQNGDLQKKYRKLFSVSLTKDLDIFYAYKVGEDRYLIKAVKPIVQFQFHQFFVSSIDGVFLPQVLGKDSIHWGLQISYPQIYQDPKTHLVEKVAVNDKFPNSELFSKLSKWVRDHTQPTPFELNGKKSYIPIRIGKKCLTWVHLHPQLAQKGLSIFSAKEL